MSNAFTIPSLLKPILNLPKNGCRPPVISMSSSRSRVSRTGLCVLKRKIIVIITNLTTKKYFVANFITFSTESKLYLAAAMATGIAIRVLLDCLPPKPPPILRTLQYTRFIGISKALATKGCSSQTPWDELPKYKVIQGILRMVIPTH